MRIELFLPAYNETKIVKQTVNKLFKHLDTDLFSVTFVDDTSRDDTVEQLRVLQKNYPFTIQTFDNGPSRRENLGVAMSESKADYVMFMDFDLATDIRHLKEIPQHIKKGAKIIIGNRYHKQAQTKREWYRWLYSKLYNGFIRLWLGSQLRDHQCGFKLFEKNVFDKLYQEVGYDHSFTRGWFWDAELLVRAQKQRIPITEIPVRWKNAEQTSFNFRRESKVIPYILKLRFRL